MFDKLQSFYFSKGLNLLFFLNRQGSTWQEEIFTLFNAYSIPSFLFFTLNTCPYSPLPNYSSTSQSQSRLDSRMWFRIYFILFNLASQAVRDEFDQIRYIIFGGMMEVEERKENQRPLQRNLNNNNIPWVQKYRPTHLDELISHQGILTTLRTFISEGNLPNLLFYGPPGTGKTSTIVAVAKELYKKDFKSMVMQLNASDERGINVVREQIKKFADTKALSTNRNMKLIILDEADMMTNTAQFALRRIIQKYHTNARFCLISNYVSKIIPALQSRCTRFKFKQIPLNAAKSRIQMIASSQNLDISGEGIEAVFRLCAGDMRRVVNMLQSLSMMDQRGIIQAQTVYDFTGNPSPQYLINIMDILLNDPLDVGFKKISSSLKQMGIALETILKSIYLMVIQRKITKEQECFLVNRIGDIEYRLSIGCQEHLALGSLVGAFTQIRFIN